MISLDLMKSSEVRIAGDQPKYLTMEIFWIQPKNHVMKNHTMENHVSYGITVLVFLPLA